MSRFISSMNLIFKYLILLIICGAVLPADGFVHAAPGADDKKETLPFTKNKELGRQLSSRLGGPVVVYETDWFYIIASKQYDSPVSTKVAPSVVDAVDEFCRLFEADRSVMPWPSSEKGRLVYLASRKEFYKYVKLFAEEADPDSGAPGYTEQAMNAQSFYWVEPLPYAAACGDSADFEDINQHVFHLLGHILLTRFNFNHQFPPAWLHEGYGAYLAHRFADGNILFCTQGLNNAMFGTGVFIGTGDWAVSDNWAYRFRNERYREDAGSLEALSILPLESFAHIDAAYSWSFVTFLVHEHPDSLRSYVRALKTAGYGGGSWPAPDLVLEEFRKAFGAEITEMESRWAAWAEEADPRVGLRESLKTNRDATIKFDPAEHLMGFESFVGESPPAELAFYQKQSDKWITAEYLEELKSSWETDRQLLKEREESISRAELARETEDQARILDRIISSDGLYYLSVGEMVSWLAPEAKPDPELFRTVICYLVERFGCQTAWDWLNEQPEGPCPDDRSALEKAARLETELLSELLEAGVSLRLDCWPEKLEFIALENRELVCIGKPLGDGEPVPQITNLDCRIVMDDDQVEIRCPPTQVNLKTFLTLCKNTLKRKETDDRVGYALLSLLRGDVKNFNSEAKRAKAHAEIDSLAELMPMYEQALVRTELLTLLAGYADGDNTTQKDRLLALMAEAKDSPMSVCLTGGGRVAATRILYEHFLSENRFLRTFKGFKGIEEGTGRVNFVFDFEETAAQDDFDYSFDLFESSLLERSTVEAPENPSPFTVEQGLFSCYGTDLAVLKPVFSGDIDLNARIRVAIEEGVEPGTFQTLIGYGLTKMGGYVGASCLTHVEMQKRIGDPIQPVRVIESIGIMDETDFYDIHLKGTSDEVYYRFDGKEGSPVAADGPRTGHVFIWACGARRFEFDSLEVRAHIDSAWLEKAIERQVDSALDAVL